MDFRKSIIQIGANLILSLANVFRLIVAPYKTLRTISTNEDLGQVYVIFGAIFGYLYLAHFFREYPYEPMILFIMIFFNYAATIIFFYLMSMAFQVKRHIAILPFLNTFAYSLIPTLVWFAVNTAFYVILPPPRHTTFLGTTFSIVFISFSVVMLMWKILLMYVSLRFSTKLPFFRLLYTLLIYIAIIIPYSIALYSFGFFRIPFL